MAVLLARLLACSDFCLDRCEPEPVTKASSSAEDKVLNKVKKNLTDDVVKVKNYRIKR